MDLLKTPAILASLFCFCGMYVGNTFYAYYTNLIIKEVVWIRIFSKNADNSLE